jgi:hypothetical protein
MGEKRNRSFFFRTTTIAGCGRNASLAASRFLFGIVMRF